MARGTKAHATDKTNNHFIVSFLYNKAKKLSGGQQAACSLSLILAIQESFPSPLYMMDEIDASLDTSIVARFGAYLR